MPLIVWPACVVPVKAVLPVMVSMMVWVTAAAVVGAVWVLDRVQVPVRLTTVVEEFSVATQSPDPLLVVEKLPFIANVPLELVVTVPV